MPISFHLILCWSQERKLLAQTMFAPGVLLLKATRKAFGAQRRLVSLDPSKSFDILYRSTCVPTISVRLVRSL